MCKSAGAHANLTKPTDSYSYSHYELKNILTTYFSFSFISIFLVLPKKKNNWRMTAFIKHSAIYHKERWNKYSYVNPFHATGQFLYPLKILEDLWFSDIFRGYRNRPVASNELMCRVDMMRYLLKYHCRNIKETVSYETLLLESVYFSLCPNKLKFTDFLFTRLETVYRLKKYYPRSVWESFILLVCSSENA